MSSTSSGFALLELKSQTAISNLNPELPDQNLRAVTGEVTLVWPYNTATKSLAFLVADPDVRRRRDKGQVRVQLQGPSAKAVAELKLGGGDAVAISLDGVEWVKDSSVVRIPGSRVDWQLQFTEKLNLQAMIGDQRERKEVNLDHPQPDVPAPTAEPTAPAAEESQMTAAPATGEPDIPVGKGGPNIPIINPITMELDEYPSPAFMKRARLSYGALFEDPEKKFEDDGGIKGKGRKRTRFGRDGSSWRYASQSPSPSPEAEPETPPQTVEAAVEVDMEKPTSSKPQMADEGCQTTEVRMPSPPVQNAVVEQASTDAAPEEPKQSSTTKVQPSQPLNASQRQSPSSNKEVEAPKKSPVPVPAVPDKQTPTPKVAARSSGFGSNTLFGNFAPSYSGYDTPRFGTTARGETGAGLGLANQVRFGFSHTPQTHYPQQQPQQLSHSAPPPQRAGDDYLESHLQPSDPSKYADMETYVDQAEQEMETEPQYAYDGHDLNPPVSETFGGGQFDIATQAQGYNAVEGGHFGADALDEGTRITTGGYAIHNDEIDVDKVPPGFASFGGGLENQIEEDEMDEDEDEDEEQEHIPGQDFVENDEVEDDLDDEVALEDRDMTEYGPEGEVLEQGDYDQREYNIPEEDDDELSEEEHQNELQAMAQNNYPDIVDEEELYDDRMDDHQDEDADEESVEGEEDQGSYDEEEEEFDEDEDDDQGSLDDEDEDDESERSYAHGARGFYDNTSQMYLSSGARPMQAARPAPPKQPEGPIVIDLLSDSDDEPPAKPAKQFAPEPQQVKDKSMPEPTTLAEQSANAPFASAPSEPLRQDPTPTRQNLHVGDQHDAVLEPSPAPEYHPETHDHARRKSSGSHLYGENSDFTVNRADGAEMNLHLPSTPPPGTEHPEASRTEKQGEGTSPTDADHDVSVVDDEDVDARSSIPSFNGAADSRPVSNGSERARVVSGGETGEDGPSDTAYSTEPSAPTEQAAKGTAPPEPSDDGALSAGKVLAHEGLDMADVITERASNPPRSDADATEASAESADISKRDVAELERLFEEEEAPDDDTKMGSGSVEEAHTRDEAPEETSSFDKDARKGPERQSSIDSPKADRQAEEEQDDKVDLPQMQRSSALPSPSFASQIFTSSPPRRAADMAPLSGGLGTQQSQIATPHQTLASDSQVPAAPVTQQELAESQTCMTETMTASHLLHAEEQGIISTEENAAHGSKADIQMDDAPAFDGIVPTVAQSALVAAVEPSVDDDMDVDDQIQAQLQYETVRTTVQTNGDDVTVVQETRKISVLLPDSSVVSPAPLPAPEPYGLEEDVPVESASLDDAIQEELMLQDEVDHEIASQVGDEDDVVEVAEDVDMEDEDVLEDDDEMEDVDAEDEPIVVEDFDEDDHVRDTGAASVPVAPEGVTEEPIEGALGADEVEEDMTVENAGQHDAIPQLQTEETVHSTIAVVPEEQPQEAVADKPDCQQESTIAVVPDEDEEEVVIIGEDTAPEHPGDEDEQPEQPTITAPPKPKQELQVLIKPQTRSQKAREQQSRNEEVASQDDASVRENTRDVSVEAGKSSQRTTAASTRRLRSKEPKDSGVELAKASTAKRGGGKGQSEERVLEPRRTRQRSASAQPATLVETEAEEEGEEDNSIALARAALESPSKKHSEPPSNNSATSRADLVRRLRITLAEFTPLRALRHHRKGHPHILAVVACDPPEPQRTKHRDYHTTITLTDASVAPDQVVEVQFKDLHKVHLPAVKKGDTMVLRNFEVVPLPDTQFALKQLDEESSWAVFDADPEVPGGRGGPGFEMQEAVSDYLHDLRVWYNDLDVTDREKLVTAMMKLAETEGSTV